MTKRIASAFLPPLLVLYPLLLLLDDLEPGFVRSVVNPHVFLLAILGVGMLAGDASAARMTRRTMIALAIIGAVIGGVWVSWRVHAGALGAIAGLLTAVAIVGTVIALQPNSGAEAAPTARSHV